MLVFALTRVCPTRLLRRFAARRLCCYHGCQSSVVGGASRKVHSRPSSAGGPEKAADAHRRSLLLWLPLPPCQFRFQLPPPDWHNAVWLKHWPVHLPPSRLIGAPSCSANRRRCRLLRSGGVQWSCAPQREPLQAVVVFLYVVRLELRSLPFLLPTRRAQLVLRAQAVQCVPPFVLINSVVVAQDFYCTRNVW